MRSIRVLIEEVQGDCEGRLKLEVHSNVPTEGTEREAMVHNEIRSVIEQLMSIRVQNIKNLILADSEEGLNIALERTGATRIKEV